MERRIDFSNLDVDLGAALIAERVSAWSEWGLIVRPTTWMDNEAGWPRPLHTDRREVLRPMSVGVQIEGPEALGEDFVFGQFVLYAGGWADADYLPVGGGDVVCECVELEDAAEFGPLLDRVVERLRPPDE